MSLGSQLQGVTVDGKTPEDADFIAAGLKEVKKRLGDRFHVVGSTPDSALSPRADDANGGGENHGIEIEEGGEDGERKREERRKRFWEALREWHCILYEWPMDRDLLE